MDEKQQAMLVEKLGELKRFVEEGEIPSLAFDFRQQMVVVSLLIRHFTPELAMEARDMAEDDIDKEHFSNWLFDVEQELGL